MRLARVCSGRQRRARRQRPPRNAQRRRPGERLPAEPGGEAGSARGLACRGHVLHLLLKPQWKATETLMRTDLEEANFRCVVGIGFGPVSHIFRENSRVKHKNYAKSKFDVPPALTLNALTHTHATGTRTRNPRAPGVRQCARSPAAPAPNGPTLPKLPVSARGPPARRGRKQGRCGPVPSGPPGAPALGRHGDAKTESIYSFPPKNLDRFNEFYNLFNLAGNKTFYDFFRKRLTCFSGKTLI